MTPAAIRQLPATKHQAYVAEMDAGGIRVNVRAPRARAAVVLTSWQPFRPSDGLELPSTLARALGTALLAACDAQGSVAQGAAS